MGLERDGLYVERDAKSDQLYISFGDEIKEGMVAKTREVFPGVYFDLDSGGKLVGIDIVNAEEVTGVPASDQNLSGELMGVKEAAEFVGKDKANFLRDFAGRPDFPKPVARLASGQFWLSRDVERYVSGA